MGWLLLSVGLFGMAAMSRADSLDGLLGRIQHTYEQTKALSADFVQVATLTTLNREQVSAGRVYIQKPYAIRWEYTQPDSQTILYKTICFGFIPRSVNKYFKARLKRMIVPTSRCFSLLGLVHSRTLLP
jgi:outer membrane lipoprotein-sorting protein